MLLEQLAEKAIVVANLRTPELAIELLRRMEDLDLDNVLPGSYEYTKLRKLYSDHLVTARHFAGVYRQSGRRSDLEGSRNYALAAMQLRLQMLCMVEPFYISHHSLQHLIPPYWNLDVEDLRDMHHTIRKLKRDYQSYVDRLRTGKERLGTISAPSAIEWSKRVTDMFATANNNSLVKSDFLKISRDDKRG